MTTGELREIQDAIRGELARCWPSARSAHDGSLATVQGIAEAQGWFDLWEDDLLPVALAAASELGRVACPLPILDAFVAGRVLGREAGCRAVATGTGLDTVAHVEAGATLSLVLLLPRGGGTARLREIEAVEETPGLAIPSWSTVRLGETIEELELSEADVDDAVALLRLGLVARALGAAGRAHELALEHANAREQFGRPIGSFQAVQHRAADGEIDLAASRLLIAEAVRIRAVGAPSALLASELAVAYAAPASRRVLRGAQHTLAAIGFFEEHEVPWLFRRVHADTLRLDDFRLSAGSPADMLLERTPRLPAFDLGEEAEAFRAELDAFFRAHGTGDPAIDPIANDPALVAAMRERGYFGLAWPREYGGREAGAAVRLAFDQECNYRRARVGGINATIGMVGDTLARCGTEEQRARFLPMIARGELHVYLGYSEPEAGSDLFSLRTRAIRDGDTWVIDGQKLWGTNAHLATHVWLAARTDPAASPPHAGISVFLFPTDTPGITIQTHRSLSGGTACTTFFDGVRVPPDCLVGELNGGWQLLTDALMRERIGLAGGVASTLRSFDDLLDAARSAPERVGGRGSERRHRIATLAAAIQGNRALAIAAALKAAGEESAAPLEGPMAKILGAELIEKLAEVALDVLGPSAALSPPDSAADFEKELRQSPMFWIVGGTNDIQRNLVARGAGLPRSTPPAAARPPVTAVREEVGEHPS